MGYLRANTEREIIAAQDQALKTVTHKNIANRNKCRLCQQFDETVEGVISECPVLAKEQSVKRRERVCAQLHFKCVQGSGDESGKGTLE
jgi:hypothetical protein